MRVAIDFRAAGPMVKSPVFCNVLKSKTFDWAAQPSDVLKRKWYLSDGSGRIIRNTVLIYLVDVEAR